MKLVTVTVIACSLLPLTANADDPDDALRFYLSKSQIVILGTIKGEPERIVEEVGVPNYICQFAVKDVAKGDAELKGKAITINIVRTELDEKDRHPQIRRDAECILFLKKQRSGNVPQLASADYWFGVQHPSPWMFKSLSRIAKEAIADDLNSSPQDTLVGTWVVSTAEDNRSALTFNADGTFELVATDPEAPQRVIAQASGTYKVDFTVSPAHLDLDAMTRKPKHEEPVKRTFEMLIQMIDTNRFRISSVGLPERPKAFGKQSHVMKRQLTPPADADE